MLNGSNPYNAGMNSHALSVVVVEAQPLMRAALGNALVSAGMTVLAEVDKPRQVMETAKSLSPDVILFSVGDPSLEDFERIRLLRQEVPSAAILALVTGELRGQIQAALDYGAHMVLTKASTRSALLEAIQKVRQNRPA